MKTLILARHAQSGHGRPGSRDHERSLTPVGRHQASDLGKKLASRGVRVERWITSSAVRACETSSLMAAELGLTAKDLEVDPRVYNASALDLLSILGETEDSVTLVLLVGHNPTMSALASQLSNDPVRGLAEAAAVHLEFDTDSWNDLHAAPSRVGRSACKCSPRDSFLIPRFASWTFSDS